MRSVAGVVTPSLTVIMPVRNEEDFIGRSLGAVLCQSGLDSPPQVILVDGDSDDATVDRAQETARSHGVDITVVDNPARTAPAALNRGLAVATGDVIVRVDGHCEIPPDYFCRCLDLLRRTGADCVGGVCRSAPTTPMGHAIAAAMSSPAGMGGVAFRSADAEPGPVDTLAFGAYPRDVFERIGGFDEELVRNQDDEFNFRLTQSGGVIWLDPSIEITYWARERLPDLFRQFRGYGLYKVRVAQKRGGVPKARHLAPLALVTGLATSATVGVASRRRWIAVGPAAGYLLLLVAAATRVASSPLALARVVAAMVTMHVAYGLGSLEGLWRFRKFFGDPPSRRIDIALGWSTREVEPT